MEKDQILEFNLISAQGLKQASSNLRRLQTYAVAWVDPSTKLRTRIDHVGEGNPTWNDKFLFRVSPNFIACETSAVNIHLYAVGYIKDLLLGTVRFLLCNCLGKTASSSDAIASPAFTAVQIRRPSGKFRGILNVAIAIHNESEFPLLKGLSAINFRELTGETDKNKENVRRLSRGGSKRSEQSSGGDSCDFDLSSLDFSSDGAESTTSSSSPATCAALREWNGLRKVGGAGKLSEGVGMLCGLMMQNKIRRCPSDLDQRFWEESFGQNG